MSRKGLSKKVRFQTRQLPLSDLKALACEARSWREWKDNMFDMIARCEAMANG